MKYVKLTTGGTSCLVDINNTHLIETYLADGWEVCTDSKGKSVIVELGSNKVYSDKVAKILADA